MAKFEGGKRYNENGTLTRAYYMYLQHTVDKQDVERINLLQNTDRSNIIVKRNPKVSLFKKILNVLALG